MQDGNGMQLCISMCSLSSCEYINHKNKEIKDSHGLSLWLQDRTIFGNFYLFFNFLIAIHHNTLKRIIMNPMNYITGSKQDFHSLMKLIDQ